MDANTHQFSQLRIQFINLADIKLEIKIHCLQRKQSQLIEYYRIIFLTGTTYSYTIHKSTYVKYFMARSLKILTDF